MRYKGEPGLLVINSKKRPGQKKFYRFSEEGFLDVPDSDKQLNDRLKARFEQMETPVEEVPEPTKNVEESGTKSLRRCKKCDFTTESQGELLAHYRDKHPKKRK